MATILDDPLIDVRQAAEFLGVAVNTLAVWRVTGRYPLPYLKIGRSVKYRLSDLEAFLESRTVTSTGEADRLDSD